MNEIEDKLDAILIQFSGLLNGQQLILAALRDMMKDDGPSPFVSMMENLGALLLSLKDGVDRIEEKLDGALITRPKC
jgi:hypothetical protein